MYLSSSGMVGSKSNLLEQAVYALITTHSSKQYDESELVIALNNVCLQK